MLRLLLFPLGRYGRNLVLVSKVISLKSRIVTKNNESLTEIAGGTYPPAFNIGV